jgi:hypothetical protein
MMLEAAAERSRPSVDALLELGSVQDHGDVQYTLLADDVLLRNGEFAGKPVSELMRTVRGRDYVGRLWRTANADMRKVIRRFFSD